LDNVTTDRARKLLDGCALFKALGERERHDLAALARTRSFATNEPIFHVGEPGSSMMGVLVGVVRISLPAPKGREVILADLPAGELFGEIALLDGEPRSASASALTNCELMVLERRDMLQFLEHNPSACLNLMQLLCARIRRSDERIIFDALRHAEKRSIEKGRRIDRKQRPFAEIRSRHRRRG